MTSCGTLGCCFNDDTEIPNKTWQERDEMSHERDPKKQKERCTSVGQACDNQRTRTNSSRSDDRRYQIVSAMAKTARSPPSIQRPEMNSTSDSHASAPQATLWHRWRTVSRKREAYMEPSTISAATGAVMLVTINSVRVCDTAMRFASHVCRLAPAADTSPICAGQSA